MSSNQAHAAVNSVVSPVNSVDLSGSAILDPQRFAARREIVGGSISHQNSGPSPKEYVLAALHGDFEKLFPDEERVRHAFMDPAVQRAMDRIPTIVVMPVTPREVDDRQVLAGIANEHLRLIGESGGRLRIMLVFNDYKASSPEQAEQSFNRFKDFMAEHYLNREVLGQDGKPLDLKQLVRQVSLNDAGVQGHLSEIYGAGPAGALTAVHRATPGKGNAVLLGVYMAKQWSDRLVPGADPALIFQDSDIRTSTVPIVPSLALPLLHEECEMSKLSFVRFAEGKLNGRLTRGFSAPIIKAMAEFYTERAAIPDFASDILAANVQVLNSLANFRYPYSGEMGARYSYLQEAPFHPTFGLESAFIIDASKRASQPVDAVTVRDVMVSAYDHMHSPLGDKSATGTTGLRKMLEDTYNGLLLALIHSGVVELNDFGSRADERSIVGRAYKIWKEEHTQMLDAVREQSKLAAASRGFDPESVRIDVFRTLGIEQSTDSAADRVKRYAKEVNTFEPETVAKLQALVDEKGYPREAVFGMRVLAQLKYELANPVFFEDLEGLLEKTRQQMVYTELVPSGEELASWGLPFESDGASHQVTLYRPD